MGNKKSVKFNKQSDHIRLVGGHTNASRSSVSYLSEIQISILFRLTVYPLTLLTHLPLRIAQHL